MSLIAHGSRRAFEAQDVESAPLRFLIDHMRQGIAGALVTICGVHNGSPRPVGSQMAVLVDGRYEGQISGGCVEPAVAAEIVPLIATGRSAILSFGSGSRYIDIRFPCGGRVDLLISVSPDIGTLERAAEAIAERRPFSLALTTSGGSEWIDGPAAPTGWSVEQFRRQFLPRTKLALFGRGQDIEVTARCALASGYDVHIASPDAGTLADLAGQGIPLTHLRTPAQPIDFAADPYTAIVLLFHDHDWEPPLLMQALAGPGFYVGALGSVRSHEIRCNRLRQLGVHESDIARIHGPIGLIAQARDPGTLALSILAQISTIRMNRR